MLRIIELCTLLSIFTLVGEAWAIRVRVEPTAVNQQWLGDTVEQIHTFGGQALDIPLHIYSHPDDSLEIRARLSQETTALLAHFPADFAVSLQKAEFSSIRRSGLLRLPLPDVEREAVLTVDFLTRVIPETEWNRAGGIRIRVYPRTILSAFQAWAEENILLVRDKSGLLQEFFRVNSIRFSETSAESNRWDEKKQGEKLLIVVDPISNPTPAAGSDSICPPHPKSAIVHFTKNTGISVPLRIERISECPYLTTDISLLAALSHNPRTQKIFLNIIQYGLRTLRLLKERGEI